MLYREGADSPIGLCVSDERWIDAFEKLLKDGFKSFSFFMENHDDPKVDVDAVVKKVNEMIYGLDDVDVIYEF